MGDERGKNRATEKTVSTLSGLHDESDHGDTKKRMIYRHTKCKREGVHRRVSVEIVVPGVGEIGRNKQKSNQ